MAKIVLTVLLIVSLFFWLYFGFGVDWFALLTANIAGGGSPSSSCPPGDFCQLESLETGPIGPIIPWPISLLIFCGISLVFILIAYVLSCALIAFFRKSRTKRILTVFLTLIIFTLIYTYSGLFGLFLTFIQGWGPSNLVVFIMTSLIALLLSIFLAYLFASKLIALFQKPNKKKSK